MQLRQRCDGVATPKPCRCHVYTMSMCSNGVNGETEGPEQRRDTPSAPHTKKSFSQTHAAAGRASENVSPQLHRNVLTLDTMLKQSQSRRFFSKRCLGARRPRPTRQCSIVFHSQYHRFCLGKPAVYFPIPNPLT